jgi:hypothetical protein
MLVAVDQNALWFAPHPPVDVRPGRRASARPAARQHPRCSRFGLGDASSDAAVASKIGSISGSALTSVVSSIAAGGSGEILGMSAAVAVPIIGAAIAGITILVTYLIANSGCGQTCIETSQWANQAATLLGQNIATYFGIPAPRSQSQQNAALANFDAVWLRLQQLCSQSSTGNAGVRCITDRQAGACTWKADPPEYPGEPAAGACWNWFNGYRDPIANDAVVADTVTSDVASASSAISSSLDLLAAATGLPAWVLPVAAVAILVVAL